jgi:hypothetical protein
MQKAKVKMQNDRAKLTSPKYEILKWEEFRSQKPVGRRWFPIADY